MHIPYYVKEVKEGKACYDGHYFKQYEPVLTSFIEEAKVYGHQQAEQVKGKLDQTKYEVVTLLSACLETITSLR